MKPPWLGWMRLSRSVKLRWALSGGTPSLSGLRRPRSCMPEGRPARRDRDRKDRPSPRPPVAPWPDGCAPAAAVCRPSSPASRRPDDRPPTRRPRPASSASARLSRHLRRQLRLARLHPPIAHRLMPAGVGLQLGPVHRHMTQRHKPRRLAQLQHLHEQRRQRRKMPPAERADRAEVRLVQTAHRHEVHPFLAGLRQPPRGAHLRGCSRTAATPPSSQGDMEDATLLRVRPKDRRLGPAPRAPCPAQSAPGAQPAQNHEPTAATATPGQHPTIESSCSSSQ